MNHREVHPIDCLPWAVKTNLPAGLITDADAEKLFEDAFIKCAFYLIGTDGYARRLVDRQTADANGLRRVFSGNMCIRGHITTRRLRSRSSECMACKRVGKARAQAKKLYKNSRPRIA